VSFQKSVRRSGNFRHRERTKESTAQIPTIAVWHDGQQYTQISQNAQSLFGFDYSASCRGLNKLGKLELWVNDNTKSGPSSYPDHLTIPGAAAYRVEFYDSREAALTTAPPIGGTQAPVGAAQPAS